MIGLAHDFPRMFQAGQVKRTSWSRQARAGRACGSKSQRAAVFISRRIARQPQARGGILRVPFHGPEGPFFHPESNFLLDIGANKW